MFRKFIAAKSFLPEALSELTEYLGFSAVVLIEAWPRVNNHLDNCRTPLQANVMDLPLHFKEIFRDCIEHAEPEVGEYLAYILQRLQIHHSRLKSLEKSFHKDSNKVYDTLLSEFYCLGELQALVNRLFPFSRNEKVFDNSPLSYCEFCTAYNNLGIGIDFYKGLEELTVNLISKESN